MITMTIAMMMSLSSGAMVIKKRKAQKAKIKDELLPVTWHPSKWWDWCVPENEKKETKTLWA